VHVLFVISDLCNQDCSFCEYRVEGNLSNELYVQPGEAVSAYGHNNPKRFIPYEKARELLRDFKRCGVQAVSFTGGGEPTLMEQALRLGLKVALISNGVSWADTLICEVLPRLSWVRVSVDAGSSDVYATIRRCSTIHWQRMWNNVTRLTQEVEKNKRGPMVGLNYVITPENDEWESLATFIIRAKDAGVDYVRFSPCVRPEGIESLHPESEAFVQQLRSEYEGGGFKVMDDFALDSRRPEYSRCRYQEYVTKIGADLQIYRCNVLAYSERGKVSNGDLREQSFNAAWDSGERRADPFAFDARKCERCRFNEQNRALDYFTTMDPPHVKFP
jgi:MoaA/NifB/PqqE/SkfB family radical SAM enzyme